MKKTGLVEQIKELEFSDEEEKELMISCAEVFVAGGLDTIDKDPFELAKSTNTQVWHWNMFLTIPQTIAYVKATMDSVLRANTNKAIKQIMNTDASGSDARRLQVLTELSEGASKKDDHTTYIITRVPAKTPKNDL